MKFSKISGTIAAYTIFTVIYFLLRTSPSEAVQNSNVKVGVADSVTSGKVIGDGIIFTDAKGRKGSVRNGAAIKASGGGLSVGNSVLAMPVTATAKSGIGWNNVKYRGKLTFLRTGSGFTVINEVDLENYVRGILKMEMSSDWPSEALKAQAILARTYAVRNRGRFGKRGYDFDAGENSQVYRGINAESAKTDQAVSQTTGMILTWQGSAADVYYHSDSGGSTADVAHVWGASRPYLQSKREAVDYTSPNSNWQTELTQAQITSIISKMKQNVGKVTRLEISQTDSAGRAIMLKVTGDKGTADVKAHSFRMAAGSRVIKSTNFKISQGGVTLATAAPAQPAPIASAPQTTSNPKPDASPDDKPISLTEMTKAGVFTSKELIDMLLNPSKKEEYKQIGYERMKENPGYAGQLQKTEPAEPPKPTAAKPAPANTQPVSPPSGKGNFVFQGKGWGHGVGLSQWGAKAMAENNMKCEEILNHYFPGTKIAK
ncbi:MAG: SpoIID/LytB domain-containing protein [Synergistaceae bacterium]|jgi:stage II sporulation protein D|nr:SpoIID/LytB domain-containing protein [Synergistaceae bacterium]